MRTEDNETKRTQNMGSGHFPVYLHIALGASGSVMLQAGWSRVRFLIKSLDFCQFTSSFQQHCCPGIDSASNRNECQEFPAGKGRPVRKGDNYTAICEPIIWKMWEPRLLTNLWASMACYRDSFTFIFTYILHNT
jgi:hypothetical protein